MERSRLDDAIKDFDHALALEPKNADALANRGLAHLWKGETEAAKQDLDAAAALNPRHAVVYRARGLLAQRSGLWREAVAAYTTSLEIDPNNSFALARRSQAHHALNEDEAALADSALVLKQTPGASDMRLLRANIFKSMGKDEEAATEARALVEANPDDSLALVTAAGIDAAVHREAEAMRLFERALAIKPEPYIYFNRAVRRPKDDIAGRRADLDAALKLDPAFTPAATVKADMLVKAGDLPAALATFTAALAKNPDDLSLHVGRGIALARSGDMTKSEADFAVIRGKDIDPQVANDICWRKATAGLALESALADCDRALAKAPGFYAFLDSRALVLLRLGRIDEAIGVYDQVLAKQPRETSSLYGRAIAWSRKGDKAKAEADAAAAAKIDPNVRERFEGYGLSL